MRSQFTRAAAFTLALMVFGAACAKDNELTGEEKRAGFVLLFDGKSMSGWKALGSPTGWVVEDGAIKCGAKGGDMLKSLEKYQNFILKTDFRVSPGANSGIFVRWAEESDPVNTGIEVQVLDSYGKNPPGKHDCGAIYDIVAPTANPVKPAGEWNTIMISAMASRLTVTLNGKPIANVDLSQYKEAGKNIDGTPNKFRYAYNTMVKPGWIGFQDHGAVVWFKNVKIRPLKPTPSASNNR